ncbi:glycosyltransferase family 2 protein [Allobacillus sp. GCM10007491]|uniref:Glycosyltransferase family 2 protein n=1 Tax=Allobacillus saliphilus TaxID=2912308 RepID=A0A941HUU7_9BACI|nr:glycosyltransferase family A protein [Allobacillus saliphilus]MBR7554754.1 glycosyltransferase family 2 protein [Allobacillus saliphilus]MBR7554919.1 glycosyltransferase family 2 protein [Allobacillus saliphilus]
MVNRDRVPKTEFAQQIKQKEMEKEELLLERKDIRMQLKQKRRAFGEIQSVVKSVGKLKRDATRQVKLLGGIALRRRDPRQLYSKSYRQKHAENQLKKYRMYLYEYGLEEAVLQDLRKKFANPKNKYEKVAIAKELLLWHANQYTSFDATAAMPYVKTLANAVEDDKQIQQLAIMESELLMTLERPVMAKEILLRAKTLKENPDVLLALTNMETKINAKLDWINQVLTDYGLETIYLNSKKATSLYDRLAAKAPEATIENGPKVSVLLPVYNAANGIETAIDSILKQSWKNIELLVIDDQSTDDTTQIVESYVEKDNRVQLLQTPENSGPYVARNIGLTNATGDFVTVNDADDWSHPRKIERQVNHLLENPSIIANTSEHARLTEDLNFYRRGLFGRFIFPNMSSLMFRKEPVMTKVGYWDEVRFAGDGEYKRRLVHVFGKESIVDLETGPLSLPRQSTNSLTASSAFGYDGHFKGARKEYVESFESFHSQAETLHYPQHQKERLFPVPEPMKPERKKARWEARHFDFIIATDFRQPNDRLIHELQLLKKLGKRIGFVQLVEYRHQAPKKIDPLFRNEIDGDIIQMITYGERVSCSLLFVYRLNGLQEIQKFIPEIQAQTVKVILYDEKSIRSNKIQPVRLSSHRLLQYFNRKGKWYVADKILREKLHENHSRELRNIDLSKKDWPNAKTEPEKYQSLIKEFLSPHAKEVNHSEKNQQLI